MKKPHKISDTSVYVCKNEILIYKDILFLQDDDDFNTRDKGRKTSWKKGMGGYQLYNLYLNLHQHRLGDDWLENSFAKKGLGCSGEQAEQELATSPCSKGSWDALCSVLLAGWESASFLSTQSRWYCSWSAVSNSAPPCSKNLINVFKYLNGRD